MFSFCIHHGGLFDDQLLQLSIEGTFYTFINIVFISENSLFIFWGYTKTIVWLISFVSVIWIQSWVAHFLFWFWLLWFFRHWTRLHMLCLCWSFVLMSHFLMCGKNMGLIIMRNFFDDFFLWLRFWSCMGVAWSFNWLWGTFKWLLLTLCWIFHFLVDFLSFESVTIGN